MYLDKQTANFQHQRKQTSTSNFQHQIMHNNANAWIINNFYIHFYYNFDK